VHKHKQNKTNNKKTHKQAHARAQLPTPVTFSVPVSGFAVADIRLTGGMVAGALQQTS
jgi:hypothetical protein